MSTVKVGEWYGGARKNWAEGVEFNFDANGYAMLARFPRPTAVEIEGWKSGPLRIGVVAEGSALLVLYEIPGVTDGDCPFSWHRVPLDRRAIPQTEIAEGEGDALQVILLDAQGGTVRSLRLIGLSTAVTRALSTAIAAQAQLREESRLYDAALNRLYQERDLWPCAVATCWAGVAT